MKKIYTTVICFLAFFIINNTTAQLISYNESVAGDLTVTTADNVFTLNTAGVHTWTCTLEPTPYPGGTDRFRVVVPAGFAITSYTYNLTGTSGVDVSHFFDSTSSYTPFTIGNGTTNNSINYTFTTPKPAGTYEIETVSDFVSSNRPYVISITIVNLCSNLALSSNTQSNISCNGGSNGAASVNIPTGGASPYRYNWTPGNPTGDGTTSISGLTAGTYICTVTDANNCTKQQSVIITQPSAITSSIASQTNASCNGGNNGSATITAGGGTPNYTYFWSPSGGNSATAAGLSAGNYTCTITDANSCTKTQSVTITQPSAITSSLTQINASCNGRNNGSATITAGGGTPNYTYFWSPSGGNSATAAGLSAGNYTCTITDANSCTKTQSVTITQPSAITSSLTQINASCNGGSNGSSKVTAGGGTAPYTYSWSPSGGTAATAAGLSAGNYTCTITDANSCTKTQSVTITQPSAITSSLTQINASCNGGSNGSSKVTAGGGTAPYTYLWSPSGGTAATAAGLAAGNYTCTITDANSCTKTQSVAITQPSAITSSFTQINVSCNGGSNGSATITAGGGTPNYTYFWSPSGGNSATAAGLAAGNYTCTITDANSCTKQQSVTISQPSAITSSFTQINASCNGGSNGSSKVTAGGGTAPYTYSWSPSGGTAATAAGLSAGNYTCTITDANSCTKQQSVTISQPSAITSSFTQINASCNGGSNGSSKVTAGGGTAPYTYSWSPSGGTAATAAGLSAGNYTCTITDANNCTKQQSVTITQPSVQPDNITTISSCASYTWSNTGQTYTISGIYIGTTANCITQKLNLTINPIPATPTVFTAQSFCGGGTIANLTATGTNIKWYDAASGGNLLASTTALVNGTTYYANQTVDGCESARTAVAVTTNSSEFVVTNLNDSGAGSFRQALIDANASTCTNKIINATAVTGKISLLSILPNISSAVTINGPTTGDLNISRDATSSNFRIFTNSAQTTINNLTITNGNDPSQAGGIYNTGDLTLNNCIVAGNTSPQAAGIQNDGVIKLTNCVVSNNTSKFISYGGANTFINCTMQDAIVINGTGALSLLNTFSRGVSASNVISAFNNIITFYNITNIERDTNGNLIGLSPVFINESDVDGEDNIFRTADDGFNLLCRSVAFNSGTNTGAPVLDILGNTRTAFTTTDIGAYESTIDLTRQAAPAAESTQLFCEGGGTIADLVATGANIQWYTVANGGTALATTTNLVTGTYYAALPSGFCENRRTEVSVIINAKPIIDAKQNIVAQCNRNNRIDPITFSVATPGGTIAYNWTNSEPAIGLAASGTGDIAAFIASVVTVPTIATITVTPTRTNGTITCVGTPIIFTITVNPLLPISAFNITGAGTFCSGATTTLSVPADINYTYVWQRSLNSIATNYSTFGGTTNTQVAGSGLYRCIVTNQYGCSFISEPVMVTTSDYVYNGSITATDLQQTGRINRFATSSTCAGKSCPGVFASSGLRYYDSYTISNPASVAVCAAVGIKSNCDSNIFMVAYSGIFNPTISCTNYLADAGSSFILGGFMSLTIPANGTITVVIHEVNPGSLCGDYQLTVDLPRDNSAITVVPNASTCPTQYQLTAPQATSYLWSPGGETTQTINTPVLANDIVYSVTLGYGNNSCSRVESVTLTTTPAPTALATQTICVSGTIENLTATGSNIKWYATATSSEPLAATSTLVNATTYYASQTIGTCESATRTAVAVTINAG